MRKTSGADSCVHHTTTLTHRKSESTMLRCFRTRLHISCVRVFARSTTNQSHLTRTLYARANHILREILLRVQGNTLHSLAHTKTKSHTARTARTAREYGRDSISGPTTKLQVDRHTAGNTPSPPHTGIMTCNKRQQRQCERRLQQDTRVREISVNAHASPSARSSVVWRPPTARSIDPPQSTPPAR